MTSLSVRERNFVLVHGAYHGGWCWRRVADLLRARGHRVFAPSLFGLAEWSRERLSPINVTTHIRDIIDLVHWEELDEVILCGHSYGGMVVTGVADAIPDRISHLVYLDALIPENGKAVADYIFEGDGLIKVIGAAGSAGGLLQPLIPDMAAFFNVNVDDRAMVDRLCTPQPIGTLIEKIALGTDHERIRGHTYIRATNWPHPAIDEAFARTRASPNWQIHEIEAGHDIMIDAPGPLVDLLCGLD